MAKKTKPPRSAGEENAKQRTIRAAEAMGHRFGAGGWREVPDGVRGQCLNRACRAHLFLRWDEIDYVAESNPTALKVRCPYRAATMQVRGAKKVLRIC
jgi:hypothetical protein